MTEKVRHAVPEVLPLWEHQREGVHLAACHADTDTPGFMYLLEQGTGKTPLCVTMLRWLFRKHKAPLRTLILCPQIVMDNWEREIAKFSHCAKWVQLLKGSNKKRQQLLATPDKHIFITNYEALDFDGLFWEEVGSGKKKSRKPLDRGFKILVCDEIHRLKNYKGSRAKVCIKIADKIFYKYGLTGTLILRDPMDVWAPFRIIDGGKTFGDSYFNFRDKFFRDENTGMPSKMHFPNYVLRIGAESHINKQIYSRAYRVMKSECLDLPPLVMQRINVDMSPEQQRHYNEMREEFITYVRDAACVAQIALSKALRLMQIVSGFLKLDNGETVSLPKVPRVTALEEIFEDYAGKKIIVWAAFKDNYHTIARACERKGLSYAMLTGQQSQAEKAQAVEDFTKGTTEVLIANPGAGGTGVNLVEAPLSVWFSRTFNLEHRLQALARNHRGGSEIHEKVTSIDLVSPGTIDELALLALEAKENIAEKILSWKL